MTQSAPPIDLLDLHPQVEEIRSLVTRGLSDSPKTLPCRLLYDERGSLLFEQICELDEYYPTRTELKIMQDRLPEMAAALGPRCAIIEYGSGSSIKSRLLLAALDDPAAYIPIEISRDMLLDASAQLASEFPAIEVLPVCADYMQPIELPDLRSRPPGARRRVVYFPGSTIGNFHVPEAVDFLRRSAKLVGPGGGMLIGVDLRKDTHILEAAYNDAQGVTAEFNLNILTRLNRELGADFDVDAFEHRAVFNEQASRIEIYIVSRVRQIVRIDELTVQFEPGQTIRTEVSYKHTPQAFAALARRAGFQVQRLWTDEKRYFSVQYLTIAAD